MSRNWLSPREEEMLLDEMSARRQRFNATRLATSPRQGALAVQHADAYPWMDPAAIQALTQAGVPADSPAALSVADMAARQAAEDAQFEEPGEQVPNGWWDKLVETAGNWAKPFVRNTLATLAVPFEELQALMSSAGTALFEDTEANRLGLVGNLAENIGDVIGNIASPDELLSDFWQNYTEKAAHAGGIIALSDMKDLGSGWLPGGDAYEQREQDKYRLTLDGQFMTPGRVFARMFTEPGSGQYQFLSGAMDFTQNIALDPTTLVLGPVSKARKATQAFQSVGLINGIRGTVDVERAVGHFLTSRQGQNMVRQWTANTDTYAAWRSIGRPDIGGEGLEAARRLAATTNDTETVNVLRDVLGTVVRERPTQRFVKRTISGNMFSEGLGRNQFGNLVGSGARSARADDTRLGFLGRMGRLGENMPGAPISVRNLDNAAIQLDRWLANAQIPDAQRAKVINRLVDVNGQGGFEDVAESAAQAVEDVLVKEWNVDAYRAKELTTLHGDVQDGHRVFDLDEVGNHKDVLAPLQPVIGGTKMDVSPMPAMVAELADDIMLPNVQEIRRLTPIVANMQRLYDSGLWKGTVNGLRAVQTNAWIPLQLLRTALTIRVVGDGQLRMAAAGHDSVFNHPMDAISWMLSVDPKNTRWQRLQNALTSDKNPVSVAKRGTSTISGQDWEDFVWFTNSLERGSGGWRGLPGAILTGNYIKVRHGQQGFHAGWADKLSHMANDPIYKRVAGGLSEGDLRSIGGTKGGMFDDVSEWFWSGTGQKWRRDLGSIEGRSALLSDRAAADAYLKQNFFDQFELVTGGNTDLVNLVATGRLGAVNANASGHVKGLSNVLRDSYDEAAPQWIGTPQVVTKGKQNQLGEAFNHLTEVGFEKFLTDPENFLTKSPTFRQMYFNRVEELISFAPRKLQEEIVKGAKSAGMDDSYLARLATRINKGEGTKLNSMADLETLAGAYAFSETRKLLYNLADRSQFMDMLKVLIPFGDVWKNVITSWSRIVTQNPSTIRRFHQGIEGARQPSIFGEAETTPGSGEGFFHTDPNTGEEVFTYPLLGRMASGMLGLPQGSVEFVGRTQGLNLVASTVLPGFGPAVTIPASHLIPNTPAWDDVRETLMPFGETPGLVDAVVPPWMEKIREVFSEPDPTKNRMFANTVTDVMRSLAATGKHDLQSQEGQQALLDEATAVAKDLYVIRGLAQFNLPTGPQLQWNAEDVAGNWVPVKLLADDLRTLTEEYGGDRTAAFQEWVKRYGVKNILAVTGKSRSVLERPVTEVGDEWLRAHAAEERDFNLTIGLFAPEDAVGEFDYTAYLRQLETGAREAVSPAEQLALANDFLGRMQFEQAKALAALHPGPVASTWLAQIRQQLAEQYPGFDGYVSRESWEKKPKPDEMITELRSAIQNPELANTDAGQGIRKYLSALDAASQMVLQLPGNVRRYQQAKAAAPVRFWLRSVAKQILEENPDFGRAWELVFSRELADDEPTLPAAA